MIWWFACFTLGIGSFVCRLDFESPRLLFRPMEAPDLTSKEMSSSYQKFTLPSKEEGQMADLGGGCVDGFLKTWQRMYIKCFLCFAYVKKRADEPAYIFGITGGLQKIKHGHGCYMTWYNYSGFTIWINVHSFLIWIFSVTSSFKALTSSAFCGTKKLKARSTWRNGCLGWKCGIDRWKKGF